jgi:hypothetical protein
MPGLTTATDRRTVTAIASERVRDLLTGPPRPVEVVATGPAAVYLSVGRELLAVVAPAGVRLPCAVVLTGHPGVSVAVGDTVEVGGGTVAGVVVAGEVVAVEVAQWFDPHVRLAGYDAAAVERLAAMVGVEEPGGADPLVESGAIDGLAAALAGGGDLAAAVAVLVGRGTGLTPAGDDVLAGTLAALRAVGDHAADRLGREVTDAVGPGGARTTRLSAALLEAAADGAVIPPAERVLRAVATGPLLVDRAVPALLAVGHTSGWHLAAGLAVGAARAAGVGAGPEGGP